MFRSQPADLLSDPPLVQVCLLDLDYNLPVQVRDSATGKEVEDLPESDVNKEYVLNRLTQDGDLDSSYNKQRANDTILKLQRTTPYYKVDLSAQPSTLWTVCVSLNSSKFCGQYAFH